MKKNIMKKNITITHDSNGTLDIVTNLLTELGVPYEGVTGEIGERLMRGSIKELTDTFT